MRLVSVLAAVAIVAILVVVWLYYGTGGQSGNVPGAPPVSRVTETKQAARGVECRNNLSQIRAALQMRQGSEESLPATLKELGLPDSMLVCPESGQPYQYDLNAGTVKCPTPGHGSF
ncbi:MAG: hypothetical protein NZL85_05340 [Fimbriimonadales bacterium]|nr:hypothetical protein [Fimbriimonadales bacterium]